MVEFKLRCYHNDSNDKIIGAEVVIYDGTDVVDTITIVDQTKLDELTEKLNNLDDTYIDREELIDILKNTSQDTIINASTFNGLASDKFLKVSDATTRVFKPAPHASTKNEYGLGSVTEHGHVKTVDNLTRERNVAGEALSAHQGYELNQRLLAQEADSNVVQHSLHSKFILIKTAGIVQLTIDDWDGESWVNGRQGWNTIFTIPEGFRPVTPQNSSKNIYCPNLFGYHLRVRINTGTNGIEIYSDGSDKDHYFYGTVTWITDE